MINMRNMHFKFCSFQVMFFLVGTCNKIQGGIVVYISGIKSHLTTYWHVYILKAKSDISQIHLLAYLSVPLSVRQLVFLMTQTPLQFLMDGVYISHNSCL